MRTNWIFIGMALALVFCTKEDKGDAVLYSDTPYDFVVGQFPTPFLPADNPLTVEGVKLGRMLFYERALSKNNLISCASCHRQNAGFSDPNRFSAGVRGERGHRQSMAVFNLAWHGDGFLWDGQAATLREQVLMPIVDPIEMDETLEHVLRKINALEQYRHQFKRAFDQEEATAENLAKALEQFLLTIVSQTSRYDESLAGSAELSPLEQRGAFLFFNEFNPFFPNISGADCVHCHAGANFNNHEYMNNGLDAEEDLTDLGRETVTGRASDRGKFKVPSLRNIALTAPYMHDGRFGTLEEVVEHYNKVKFSPTLDPSFLQQLPAGLELSAYDKEALVTFMKTLTDPTLAHRKEFSDPH
jgi:cytochrome c peroxidase